LKDIVSIFDNREFEKLEGVLSRKDRAFADISEMIEKQIQRTRTEESSTKKYNTFILAY